MVDHYRCNRGWRDKREHMFVMTISCKLVLSMLLLFYESVCFYVKLESRFSFPILPRILSLRRRNIWSKRLFGSVLLGLKQLFLCVHSAYSVSTANLNLFIHLWAQLPLLSLKEWKNEQSESSRVGIQKLPRITDKAFKETANRSHRNKNEIYLIATIEVSSQNWPISIKT